MEEPAESAPLSKLRRARPALWSELGLLALLLILAGGIRIWLIFHTTVPARDSIGFIRYAWQLANQPWKDVLRTNAHPPLYPLTILAASVPVRYFGRGPDAFLMQFSAQLASGVAGIVLVIPMYFMGREVFQPRVGFWGAALFQCLPVAARVTSDALSEGIFLLLLATALAFGFRAVRRRSALLFALCGLFGALAYLTRPEGMLVVAATGLVLIGVQAVARWRAPWWRTCLCAGSLALTTVLVAGPYVLVIGALTNKPTAKEMMGSALFQGTPGRDLPVSRSQHRRRSLPDLERITARVQAVRQPLVASALAITWNAHDDGPLDENNSRLWWSLWALGGEVIKDFHYVAGIPVLLGLWWSRDRLRLVPGSWVVLLLCLLHGLVVLGVALSQGYVSERHTLVLVLCGTFLAAAGIMRIAPIVVAAAAAVRRAGPIMAEKLRLTRPLAARLAGWQPGQLSQRKWIPEVALMLGLVTFGLPEILKPLHANRAGHRAAGLWLAQHTMPADQILDPFCWAHYYAGRVFLEGTTPKTVPGYQPQLYVVLEHSRNGHAHLPMMAEANRLAEKGTVVYHCPVQEQKDKNEEVVVYCVPQ